MKSRNVFALIVAVVILAASLTADSISDNEGVQIGTPEVISNAVASTALASVPTNAQWIVVTVRASAHIETRDGQAATTSSQYWPTGSGFILVGRASIVDLRVINSTDGACEVYVTYWRKR